MLTFTFLGSLWSSILTSEAVSSYAYAGHGRPSRANRIRLCSSLFIDNMEHSCPFVTTLNIEHSCPNRSYFHGILPRCAILCFIDLADYFLDDALVSYKITPPILTGESGSFDRYIPGRSLRMFHILSCR